MKTIEAISVLNLTKEINSIDEVKKSYRKLSMKYHPDINPSGENMMKMINEAYEHLTDQAYPLHLQSDEEINRTILEDYENILSKLFTFKNISIELCGTWIWVTGETREIKEELKELGLYYAKNKVAWYYTKTKKLFYRGKRPSLDDIRTRFGSQGIKEKQNRHYALA